MAEQVGSARAHCGRACASPRGARGRPACRPLVMGRPSRGSPCQLEVAIVSLIADGESPRTACSKRTERGDEARRCLRWNQRRCEARRPRAPPSQARKVRRWSRRLRRRRRSAAHAGGRAQVGPPATASPLCTCGRLRRRFSIRDRGARSFRRGSGEEDETRRLGVADAARRVRDLAWQRISRTASTRRSPGRPPAQAGHQGRRAGRGRAARIARRARLLALRRRLVLQSRCGRRRWPP